MYDHREFAGVPADLATYIRTEYNGDHGYVLAAITRAGRATPAVRKPTAAQKVVRAFAKATQAVASVFASPSGA